MFKLVVLSALVALAVAKPSGIVAPLTYSTAAIAAVPAAVSHQYRTDVISKPLIATTYAAAPVVAAPVVQKTLLAAPLSYSAGWSTQSRVDYHHPTVYAAAAPVAYAAAAPYGYGAHALHAPIVNAW